MSDKFEEVFLFVIFRRLSGPDYFLEPRPDLYCLQITSLRMNDRMTFFGLKKVDSLTSVVHFYSRRLIFLCVRVCVMKCSDLLSAVPLSVSLSLRFLFSFISQKAPPPPLPSRELLLTCSIYCVCVCVLYVTATISGNLRSSE